MKKILHHWDDQPGDQYEHFKPISDSWRYEDLNMNMDKYDPSTCEQRDRK